MTTTITATPTVDDLRKGIPAFLVRTNGKPVPAPATASKAEPKKAAPVAQKPVAEKAPVKTVTKPTAKPAVNTVAAKSAAKVEPVKPAATAKAPAKKAKVAVAKPVKPVKPAAVIEKPVAKRVYQKITVIVKENPYREGTLGHDVFKLYKTGQTVEAFCVAVNKSLAHAKAKTARKPGAFLSFDVLKKHVKVTA